MKKLSKKTKLDLESIGLSPEGIEMMSIKSQDRLERLREVIDGEMHNIDYESIEGYRIQNKALELRVADLEKQLLKVETELDVTKKADDKLVRMLLDKLVKEY